MMDENIGTDRRVTCSVEGQIGWLKIDNPLRKNAMSLSMWHQLGEGLDALAEDTSVRVVVITGADGRNFCSGADISEFSEHRSGAASMDGYDQVGRSAFDKLRKLAKPVIAMIEGCCMGGGMGLASCCDLRIAADTVRLGVPAARRGLSYGHDGLRLLVGLVGPSAAKLIMYTAREFDAEEALRMGLVDEVVSSDHLREHVVKLAETIAGNAPLSIAASKFIIDMISNDGAAQDPAACAAWEARCLQSADYVEATSAFMERRPAIFRGV